MNESIWTMTVDPSMKDHSNINFTANGNEMLRVAKDGFYVRGVKIKQDEKEAEQVYNAFHQWLMWANLTRDY